MEPCGFCDEAGIFVVVMIDRSMSSMRDSCALLEKDMVNY